MVGSFFLATAIVIPNPNKIDAPATVAKNVVSAVVVVLNECVREQVSHLTIRTDPASDPVMSFGHAAREQRAAGRSWQSHCGMAGLRDEEDQL